MSRTLQASPGLAGAWAVTFVALSLLGLLGRTPHPWQPVSGAPLGELSQAQLSWVVGMLGLVTLAALAVGLASQVSRRVHVAGWLLVVTGVAVAVVVSDVRALAVLGYLPMILLALGGVGPAAGHLEWSLFTEDVVPLAHAAGGVAIAATGALTLARAGALAGRGGLDWSGWVRWTRPAVVVAAVVPLAYAATRIAWAAGVPLGISQETLDMLDSARFAGLGLALFACVGAWLTTGLVSRWGEVFWSWLPVLGGRPVPVSLAVVPGLFVAGAVMSAGLSFWAMVVVGGLSTVPGAVEDWAAWGPALLWPLWGVALAVATLGYLGRRLTRAVSEPAVRAGT
ncbi:hypothetical protein DDE18_17145 [Nocardioides gansuensis]|uniref:Uncharacterized protein n=1 Tax=Nocardioides gansuensis TaxID=2138300 RepID=A0A2T8F7L7_9ACTN|nr:hypothetical protein [Nocardioides gansuensis]PVG81708.1 hypothetical protein DDE18_17145 [Nocardioides gansuensis]